MLRHWLPRRREVLPSSRITPLNACPDLRSRWCPIPLALARAGLLPSSRCNCRLWVRLPDLSSDHHYTFFGIQFRGLRPRLASASHTVSRRSHFGSATDPVASLWSGGIDRLTPTHPLGNNDEFQGVSPLFHRPGLFSARAAPGSLADINLISQSFRYSHLELAAHYHRRLLSPCP